ncbi:MAG: NADH-quinone oxidoreductase subunit G, partial [Francisellaceae bacterium]
MNKVAEKETPKRITMEIDGKTVIADPGQMLIQVADDNNVYIPRFCYHKKLSIAANCRMCLVDVEGARKPSPACATPIMDGMKVFTKSPKTIAYQQHVMEFLLINHPLDCPICDQGGECELQDVAMGYGQSVSNYSEKKRVMADPDLGSLVATDMTRCICCTRCVRFGEEISGMRELGGIGRGDSTAIGTYIEKSLDSELSGNVIDVCPVGALTSKPYRYAARAWELQQSASISPGDGMGSNIYVHARRNEVMRVVPRENEAINEVWLSDRDRFSYEGLNSEERITQPMIKKNDDWCDVSWEEALDFARASLDLVRDKSGADKIAALGSESSTTEELYLLQKLVRGLGSNNVDSRMKQGQLNADISAGEMLDCDFETIEQSDCILLVGSNLRKEVPLLNHRVRKAQINGSKVFAINTTDYNFNYDVTLIKSSSNDFSNKLVMLAKELSTNKISRKLAALCDGMVLDKEVKLLARSLESAKNPIILIGQMAIPLPDFASIFALVASIKDLSDAKGGVLGFGANSVGAKLANCLPYTVNGSGYNAQEILSVDNDLEAIILLNLEPEHDSIYGQKSIESLRGKDFVISLSSFAGEEHKLYSDVILPITPFTETRGSYFNYHGLKQTFAACVVPKGESKPGWKVLRVLGNLLNLDGFDYNTSDEVISEVTTEVEVRSNTELEKYVSKGHSKDGISIDVSLYGVDSLTRRSKPLSLTMDHQNSQFFYVSSEYAKINKISDSDEVVIVCGKRSYGAIKVKVDDLMIGTDVCIPLHMYDSVFAERGFV